MLLLPDDPMAVLALLHDVILTRVDANEDGTRRRAFYICESCCCIFWPDDDGDGAIYPDRFTHVGLNGTHCDEDEKCGSHNFPYRTLDVLDSNATWTLAWEDT